MNEKNKLNTKKESDKIVKVKVNDEIASLIDERAKDIGKPKSVVLRDLIYIISSKNFEQLVPNTNLELLQAYSEKCWNILHTDGCIFEVEKLSDRMPAFISTCMPPMVYVKYPTFKIQIFDSENIQNKVDANTINALLGNIKNVSEAYFTPAEFLVKDGEIQKFEFPYITELTCLSVSLEENINNKNAIVQILQSSNYHTIVYPGYCYRAQKIELLEDKKYFRIINERG